MRHFEINEHAKPFAKTVTYDAYEIACGLRCDVCKKLFKMGKRRKSTECKCPR